MYSILTVQIYLAEYILCMFGLRNAIEIGSSLTFASEFYWSVTRREREKTGSAKGNQLDDVHFVLSEEA